MTLSHGARRRFAVIAERHETGEYVEGWERMGPVTVDLRIAGSKWWLLGLPESLEIWQAATESLGLQKSDWGRCADDISSEAITHAEYLGL